MRTSNGGGASNMRAWSWVRIDGRNVVAIPTQQQIHLYDSDDFILLATISPTGHASAVTKVRWSAFHAKLASLSATQLIVHAPQLDDDDDDNADDSGGRRRARRNQKVSFVPMWEFRLPGDGAKIHSFSFSRCAEQLLYSDNTGIGILDIHNHGGAVSTGEDATIPQAQLMWRSTDHEAPGDEIVKFSPSAFVFGSSKAGQHTLKIWRVTTCEKQDADYTRSVLSVNELAHPEPIVYYSWKPANSQLHVARALDGSHKAQWFEPARILLTCTLNRTIRIWTEAEGSDDDDGTTVRHPSIPKFITVLMFEPSMPIDNFRWVLSKNRNLSEEKFESTTEKDRTQIDWLSGVDRQGVLHLWRLVGIPTTTPTIEETGVCIKVNDEEIEHQEGPTSTESTVLQMAPLQEICIMAYFSQDDFAVPSALDIILQREDNIIISYSAVVARKSLRPRVKRKCWYRSHTGAIVALAAHPSLPLIASVGAEPTDNDRASYEVLIFWISFSAFSAESRLIPSGVLKCAKECGEILSVQWVPTLHFDATPLLLVVFASGTIIMYGRAADAAGVVSSPKGSHHTTPHHFSRAQSVAPWTFFDYNTGESGIEYEVTSHKYPDTGIGFSFESKYEKLVVAEIDSHRSSFDQVSLGDELVGINNKSVIGRTPEEVHELLDAVPTEGLIFMRFRAKSSADRPLPVVPISSDETQPHKLSTKPSLPTYASLSSVDEEPGDKTVEKHALSLQHSFLATMGDSFRAYHQQSNVVHAGTVSMYGGWQQLLNMEVATSLALLCVAPVYVDDGEYEPSTVLIFGLTSLPGKLNAWKGVRSSSSKSYDISALSIQNSTILRKHDITSVAGERDYRQRAFSSKRLRDHGGLNSLLFLGDASGSVQHWRCQVSGENIAFTLMSSCSIPGSPQDQVNGERLFDSDRFFRRGYVVSDARKDGQVSAFKSDIRHIEVDDPNRIALLDSHQPNTLHIYEAESGLGILRLEESIRAAGRGNIMGFCWCNAHVEFNVDVLAVQYTSGIVLYQYDMNLHRWVQIGDDIKTPFSIFDCTRDSSALLIGGGFLKHEDEGQDHMESKSGLTSNEMPEVLGKWDEPGNFLQYSMDWKAPESPQKLPVWHPYVIITTLFGMHARVGVKDTQLAGDKPVFEFSKAFKDAVQMLKLLAKVIDDDISAQLSARSGVLSYAESRKSLDANGIASLGSIGRRDSVGRYSTTIHQNSQMNKAENLFGGSSESDAAFITPKVVETSSKSNEPLSKAEAAVIAGCIDALLLKTESLHLKNGALMFASFDQENLLEMKAVLHYVDTIQSLGFELDASAADLGAKRHFSSHVFTRSLKKVICESGLCKESVQRESKMDAKEHDDGERAQQMVQMWLEEPPSSGILWALHSDAQQFLLENCVHPQATWAELKPLWLGLWMKSTKDLRTVIERLAKSTFARTKDAMDVCLYYIALGKTNVLGALAKLSKSDQCKKLALFLDHDFSQERWCNAAVKNAYSLLSKKQYETAAAFFLICEPPRLQEALRVLAVRMSDHSLALTIGRLVEYRMSDNFQHDFINSATQNEITEVGDITRALLDQDIIPYFRQRKDRWMESCALWWLQDFEQACTVLLPHSQAVDAVNAHSAHPEHQNDLAIRCKTAVHFYINVTSSPIYFQYLHSSINSTLISWAAKKRRQALAQDSIDTLSAKKWNKLASTADIEHAYSFAAYACKRNGLSDTALVEMLQARHLVNVHARFEIAAAESDNSITISGDESELEHVSTSPRYRSSMRNLTKVDLQLKTPQGQTPWSSSPRRMSDIHQLDLSPQKCFPRDDAHRLHKSKTANVSLLLQQEKSIPAAPWLKAQIADIECRRWSSSAFVGKMIGIRVAREMISHFRAELDLCFRHYDPNVKHFRAEPHQEFLEELCAPLCKQFEVDRNYVLEAALGVMQPHAYLHIVEVCFLLSELGRSATLCKWVQYVSLSMLHSCSTFASCKITDDIYRDWEGLTIQLCYILNLDAQDQLQLPNSIVAQVAVAVRTGCIFLGWCRHRSKVIHEAILAPFFVNSKNRAGMIDDEYFAELSMFSFETNLTMIRQLQQEWGASSQKTWNFAGTFGYTFLETVAAYLQGKQAGEFPRASTHEKLRVHWHKLRKMYTLILMVSILRTHYARAQVFLMDFRDTQEVRKDLEELDISSSLFTPRKMWKVLEEGPLDGIKRWYSLMESHLRCEFDYSVKEETCLCGLYGLDGSALKLAEQATQHIDRDGENDKAQAHQTKHSHNHDSPKIYNVDERYDVQNFLHEIGISNEIHSELVKKSDDYVLLLMQHPRFGIPPAFQRFRVDPRVYIKCFFVKNAFDWFSTRKIFSTTEECQAFLSRCCKNRKLRLLAQIPSEDSRMFPLIHTEPHHFDPAHDKNAHHHSENGSDGVLEVLNNKAMMFVDPWEVEAEGNVLHYMHRMHTQRHVELGWDRLSPICTETCDDVIGTVFGDQELVDMWKSTCGEGWLVTSITQYQLDGGYIHRTGHVGTHCVEEEEQKVPFLVEVHARSQRNAMFREVGLPHRFIGVLSVALIEGRELIPCGWVMHTSDPYVFLELVHDNKHETVAESWDIRTYRSRVGDGGVNPRWGTEEDAFSFRFAIPTHRIHTRNGSDKSEQSGIQNVWSAAVTDESQSAARGLESLFQTMHTGPPVMLNCSVYHKNKLMHHQFMGKGTVPLNQLTSGNPIDCWVPLEGVPNGSLHVQLSLSFQLMCSSVAGAHDIDDIVDG
uniref:C2 domain-containing protein n=1 Tax=Globisporangium ultimum (strain ATCC 200006 / CBS 805.95 / DAOM BR144) TaxID=431595 RepID=K3WB75_GLOUD